MDNHDLAAMLKRSTEDPPESFVAATLARSTDWASTGPDEKPPAPPGGATPNRLGPEQLGPNSRNRRYLTLATSAAVFVLVAIAVVLVSRSSSGDDFDVASHDPRVEVIIDGERVPDSRIGEMEDQIIDLTSPPLGGTYKPTGSDLQVDIAAQLLFKHFLRQLGVAEGDPVTAADIEASISDSTEIRYHGEVIDKEDVRKDSKLRSNIKIGLQTSRGLGVLAQRLGSPEYGDGRPEFRNWFKEQLAQHDVIARVDGHEIDHTALSNSQMVFPREP
ncbi:MAG: hypothetical protein WBA45_09470 [Microthrixaceae bacterium]